METIKEKGVLKTLIRSTPSGELQAVNPLYAHLYLKTHFIDERYKLRPDTYITLEQIQKLHNGIRDIILLGITPAEGHVFFAEIVSVKVAYIQFVFTDDEHVMHIYLI